MLQKQYSFTLVIVEDSLVPACSDSLQYLFCFPFVVMSVKLWVILSDTKAWGGVICLSRGKLCFIAFNCQNFEWYQKKIDRIKVTCLLCIFSFIKHKRDAYVSRLNQIYRSNLDKVGCVMLFFSQSVKCKVICGR